MDLRDTLTFMSQTRQRRIFLAYKSARRAASGNRFSSSWAWEYVARTFRLPIRHVKDIVADEKRENARREATRGNLAGTGKGPGECMHTGEPRLHRGSEMDGWWPD